MDRTQSEILVFAVIGILLVLLFGSPIRRKVDVAVTGDTGDKTGHGSDKVSEATHSHAELKFVSRENVG